MGFASLVILHGAPGIEMTLQGYLFRVVLALFAFVGIAVIVLFGFECMRATPADVVGERTDGKDDP